MLNKLQTATSEASKVCQACTIDMPEGRSLSPVWSQSRRAYTCYGNQEVGSCSRYPQVDNTLTHAMSGHRPHRDRENATVMVANLASTTNESDLRKLFRDVSLDSNSDLPRQWHSDRHTIQCGDIREMKLKTVGGETVATVEFTARVRHDNRSR